MSGAVLITELQGPRKAYIGVKYLNLSMNGDRPGKPPKPPLKGDKFRVADFFKPSYRTASKKAAEGEAAKTHA